MRSVLSVVGACWFAACSFPSYTTPDPLLSICTDGLPSAAETGTDCGGGCPPCGMGEKCRVATDCASLSCMAGVCQAPTCDDKAKNATETDVDCGGPCSPCRPGRDCQANLDCEQGVCAEGFCQFPTCTDTVLNGSETGLDCGGSCDPCD
ncbi:MAG TPA: hypothetical protein VNG33_07445, partial [Polyangiaceae bacterium]|nr:hypothetical protein [Polyangiaceae bacterium]